MVSVTVKPQGQRRPGSWACRWLSSGFTGEKQKYVTQNRSLALGRLYLVQGFLRCPWPLPVKSGQSHCINQPHTSFPKHGPVCRKWRLTRAGISVGCSAASCREQLGPATPLGQVDVIVPRPRQVGTVGWPSFCSSSCIASPWILERRCLVASHPRLALLCVEMVWVRSGASLRKFVAGTEFFRAIADVCLCPDMLRRGPDLRHQQSVSGGSSGLHAWSRLTLCPFEISCLGPCGVSSDSGPLCPGLSALLISCTSSWDLPVPACPPIEWGLGSGFWPDAVPVRPSHHVVVHWPICLLSSPRTWS